MDLLIAVFVEDGWCCPSWITIMQHIIGLARSCEHRKERRSLFDGLQRDGGYFDNSGGHAQEMRSIAVHLGYC